jgi:hypothetical protein
LRPARLIVVVICLPGLLGLAACSSSSKGSSAPSPSSSDQEPWPAPPNPMELAQKAGLEPENAERLEYHVHAHLDVFLNGSHILVPAGIGIDTTNPAVHKFTILGQPAWGGIDPPCDQPCISPLHTHDVSGVLHTESATHKDNTLGQFFIQWNVKLTANCVATYCKPATPIAVYVNGSVFTGDPTTIPLSNYKEIAIIIGTRPAQIPSGFDKSLI